MPPTLWYYEHEGKSGGPVTVSQLRQLASSGQLSPTDKVRKDDMTKWVKARAVKGLFAPEVGEGGDVLTSPSTVEGDIETGASVFDFFGVGAAAPAAAPKPEENTVFDFFNPNSAPAPSPAPPPTPKKTKSVPPPPPSPRKSAVPVAKPAEFRPAEAVAKAAPAETPSGVPLAAEVVEDDEEPVPLATPASGVLDEVAVFGSEYAVSGPSVDLLPDGGAVLTGGQTTLQLTGRWLRAKTTGPAGPVRQACLRMSRLDSAVFGRRGAHAVLSFHAGAQSVAVACAEGSDKAFRAFFEKVLGQK